MSTLEHYVGNETLVVERCWCGILHAIPAALARTKRAAHEAGQRHNNDVYCPLGHRWIYGGDNRMEAAERKLQQERAAHDQTRAARDEAQKRLCKEEAARLRLKRRIKAGICPCCKRTVSQMARHIASKHPEYCKK